jgi:hypothetical protein
MVKICGHSPYRGKSYKLCPYSAQYKEAYYDLGYLGNSTNPNIPMANTSAHPYTEGTMNSAMCANVWGYMCMDDNCWFYTTYNRRYTEV